MPRFDFAFCPAWYAAAAGLLVFGLATRAAAIPIIDVFATPNPGYVGEEITFEASGIDDPTGIPIEHWDWDLDADGAFELIDAGPVATRTFGTPGIFSVQVRGFNDAGEPGGGEAVVEVLAVPEPSAALLLAAALASLGMCGQRPRSI